MRVGSVNCPFVIYSDPIKNSVSMLTTMQLVSALLKKSQCEKRQQAFQISEKAFLN